MAATDVLNDLVEALIPGDVPVEGLGFLHFFLTFFFIFSTTFTAAAYIPAFKSPEMKNARMIIALTMAYFGATAFFTLIIQYLQWFGFLAALSIGVGGAVLMTVPGKEKRTKYASAIMGFGFLVSLAIVGFVFCNEQYGEECPSKIAGIFSGLWNFIQDNVVWLIIGIVAIVGITVVISSQKAAAAKRNPPT